MPSIWHNSKARGTLLARNCSSLRWRARDDPGSVRMVLRTILDGERLLIETRYGKKGRRVFNAGLRWLAIRDA
jgi:hypothetical protein